MTAGDDAQSFLCLKVPPAAMDRLWAEGWRHFGVFFFQYRASVHNDKRFTVIPLRIDIQKFVLSRSQKRVLRINRDVTVALRPSSIDATKEKLFAKHRRRFTENIPSSLCDFLSPTPASVPCTNVELCVYNGKKLLGVTFLDIGETAMSAVYAIFDPAAAQRSPGILMILHSIRFSIERGCRYYYPGYAYREPSSYDYKKRFLGSEYLEWDGGWKPFAVDQSCGAPNGA